MSEGSQPASLLAYRLPHTLGQKVMTESMAVVIASDQGALPVTFSGTVTITGAVTVSNFPATQPISAVSLPLPTGAATLAAQTQPGVDIGDVTINNAAGASAVNIQDGGNAITVDGSVTVTQATGTNLHIAIDKLDLVASSPASAAVGVASGAVLASNASRDGAVVVNTSTGGQRISLGLDGAAAVLDSGITLWPGDSWVMDEYTFTNGAIAGIASAASAAAAVQEFT